MLFLYRSSIFIIFIKHLQFNMRLLFTSVLIFLSVAGFCKSTPFISYTITPFSSHNLNSLLVVMKFNGNASGTTELLIPYNADATSFTTDTSANTNQPQLIEVRNCQYREEPDHRLILQYQPFKDITITYRVNNLIKDTVPADGEYYTTIVNKKYFYILGESLWMIPNDSSQTKYKIEFNWKGFPASCRFLNSFTADVSNHSGDSISLHDLQNSIFMGGDIRIYHMSINNRPVYFGIRGKWGFSDQEILQVIKKIVAGQRQFWNDHDFGRYTISLLPLKYASPENKSINGRSLYKTFVTEATNMPSYSTNDLLQLYNHELMHHWFSDVILQGSPENDYKWFMEGFNDYFAHYVMKDRGLISTEEFNRKINEKIASYYSDSTNQYSNAIMSEQYWSSSKMQQLPYTRGLIFAFYLNESIIKKTGGRTSLKNVIAQMLAESRNSKRQFDNQWLLTVLKQFTEYDYSADIDQYILQGRFIPIQSWHNASDRVVEKQVEVFHFGFKTQTGQFKRQAVISYVTPMSNIEKAGLKVGDIILDGDYKPGDPKQAATLKVQRGDQVIDLAFYPSKIITVPQIQS